MSDRCPAPIEKLAHAAISPALLLFTLAIRRKFPTVAVRGIYVGGEIGMLCSILSWGAWSAVIAGIVSCITTRATLGFNRERLKREFRLEFATEAAIRALLSVGTYEMRTFDKIKHHLPGLTDDNELRRYLIRAGAVSFKRGDGTELWGLLEKHEGAAFK